MSKLEVTTEQFESVLVDKTVVVHLKSSALEIVTQPALNEEFFDLLESVNDSGDLLGYVQINSEYQGRGPVEELAQRLAGETVPARSGRFSGGYQHDMIAARFRNTIGRILLRYMELEVPSVAGIQGAISGDYLGLMLAFDSRVATADATISFDNVRIGWPGSPGLTHLMPRITGTHKALDMIHRGATIGAEEALELGLISEIIETAEELTSRCAQAVRDITPSHRHLVKAHRLQVLPPIDDMQLALERYYDHMADAVLELKR